MAVQSVRDESFFANVSDFRHLVSKFGLGSLNMKLSSSKYHEYQYWLSECPGCSEIFRRDQISEANF
jgi:hypothetical protein